MTGSFGPGAVTVSGTIGTADLSTLADGPHPVLVRGRDAAGNWGPTSTTSLVVDRAGPTAVGVAAAPNPSQGSHPPLFRRH